MKKLIKKLDKNFENYFNNKNKTEISFDEVKNDYFLQIERCEDSNQNKVVLYIGGLLEEVIGIDVDYDLEMMTEIFKVNFEAEGLTKYRLID